MKSHDRGMAAALAAGGVVLEVGVAAGPAPTGGIVPGCEADGTEISVIVSDGGKIAYKNMHNRGAGLKWVDLRESIEPGYKTHAAANGTGGKGDRANRKVPPRWPGGVELLGLRLVAISKDEVRLLPIELDAEGDWVSPDPGPERCPRCGRRLVVRLLPITLDER